jgi:isoleucyl-tRNA synthetase
MAPILSFTAEEAWAVFNNDADYQASGETIFTQQFYPLPAVNDGAALLKRYEALREIRAGV